MRKGQALVVLFGLWLVCSPWMFTYAIHAHATLDTIVGLLVVAAGAISAVTGVRTAAPLWVALALGLWTFATPMTFGEAGTSFSANNDLIVGPLLALAASVAIVSRARMIILAGPPDPDGAEGQASLW